MPTFQTATRTTARLRLGLIGPAGSGKTYTALLLAHHLGRRTALIDTEHGSASKYALPEGGTPIRDGFTFDVLALDSFHPQTYIDAIHAAEKNSYDTLIIDSLSHAWMGKDGALELVDKAAARERGNSFAAWRHVTPLHNQLVDAMLACRCHLIATLRAKTEYVQEKDDRTGKTIIRKLGLQPIQRDGIEFEFDVIGDLDLDNTLIVGKTRCPALHGAVLRKPGQELATTLQEWLQGFSGGDSPKPAHGKTVPVSDAAQAPDRPDSEATPTNGSSSKEGAFGRYLKECQQHQERIGERLYYQVLQDNGLEDAHQIPECERLIPKGLRLQKRVLTILRSQPDRTSDLGFDNELQRIAAECLEAGAISVFNAVLEDYVDTPLDADAEHIPPEHRLELLEKLEQTLRGASQTVSA